VVLISRGWRIRTEANIKGEKIGGWQTMTTSSTGPDTARIPIRANAFVEGDDGMVLRANRCKTCGQIFFPGAALCYACLGTDLEDLMLSRSGKLHSYTISHMPSAHFAAPYAVGYVDMPEGVRLFTPLKIVEDKPFKIGMDVEVFGDSLWKEDATYVYGYKFMPV
jgi:uncharacterized OB-fold protein